MEEQVSQNFITSDFVLVYLSLDLDYKDGPIIHELIIRAVYQVTILDRGGSTFEVPYNALIEKFDGIFRFYQHV